MLLFIDVDDVCAQLGVEWLGRYNKDYNDRVQVSDLTNWAIDRFVKCGNKIYRYLDDPTLYDNVKVTKGALEGVKALRKMGHRVAFATSTPMSTAGRKFQWLKDNGFEPTIKDYVELNDKSLLRGDFLFDDRFDNVVGFEGHGILLTRPWNKNETYLKRVNNWKEFVRTVSSVDTFIKSFGGSV